jgi:hypothetical protein
MKLAKYSSWWILFLSFCYGFLERSSNFLLDSILTGNELGQYVIIVLCFLLLIVLYPEYDN